MYLSAEMVVYNKKKIQMIVVEYGFNFTSEVRICIFHEWRDIATHEVQIFFFFAR